MCLYDGTHTHTCICGCATQNVCAIIWEYNGLELRSCFSRLKQSPSRLIHAHESYMCVCVLWYCMYMFQSCIRDQWQKYNKHFPCDIVLFVVRWNQTMQKLYCVLPLRIGVQHFYCFTQTTNHPTSPFWLLLRIWKNHKMSSENLFLWILNSLVIMITVNI